ncbi:hypothetical protein L3Q82_005058 [Scortum barcoo]|uniref:Uncharacterized protein n=1 Tax=Scortum barcoo TaxID=214431 RepID=A0ACB8VG03_9TELE|nr:hypothetical protein L3Q82_005058 [Scortum barcoo]
MTSLEFRLCCYDNPTHAEVSSCVQTCQLLAQLQAACHRVSSERRPLTARKTLLMAKTLTSSIMQVVSTEDAITLTLTSPSTACPLPPGPEKDTYVRMLFIDYSSAFNTIVPSKLVTKLRDLGLNKRPL